MKKLLLFFITCVVTCLLAEAQLRLPRFFADHMILQRDKPVQIWGWGTPGNEVEILFKGKSVKTKSAKDSTWQLELPATTAGGPHNISVRSTEQKIIFSDVYFGDVWFCGGQSNMNFRMRSIKNRDEEIKDANYPLIRQLNVDQTGSELPQRDIPKGEWVACNSKTIDVFTAVGFQFAKEVFKSEGVPIGLIHASWGGSPIQTFMSPASLNSFAAEMEKVKAIYPGFIKDRRVKDTAARLQWEQNMYTVSNFISPDRKLDRDASFFEESKSWEEVQVPGFVEDQKIKARNGISWFKRRFNVKPSLLKDTVLLDLGQINFSTAAFVNGRFVGAQLNSYYPASFKMPGSSLKEGENEILVCVFNENGSTGFRPTAKPTLKAGAETVSLMGTWHFRQGKTFDTTGALGRISAVDFVNSYPSLAYNSMIRPLQAFALKGFLWYQGEANTSLEECSKYEALLTSLIDDWRKAWSDSRLPFLMVQIANYGRITAEPTASGWAVVQEAQAAVAQKVPHTGIAITNDVGNPVDVHPTDKQTVGKRLAAVALNQVYGKKNLVAAGPTFSKMEVKGGKAILSFKNTGSKLVSRSGSDTLSAFALAGLDNHFYRATATLKNNTVIVSSEKVPEPVHVRYAFESSPPAVDFYNKEGFPAVPFRTDKLPVPYQAANR